jgi:Cu(I)/Ag(I) efflux system membrane protein CusA/SilA
MTTATTFLGLLPILWAADSGSRVMKRLATPMIGGLVTDMLVTLIIIPLVYEWIQLRDLRNNTSVQAAPVSTPKSN